MSTGTLYIVATPIGNLEDITFRAVRILGEVDLIAAEDTRHSRKLLSHFGISRPITSYYDHNKEFKGNYILDKLREGLSVALIADAGTPCISDPGYQLTRDAASSGIPVVPVPGPSAAIAALSAAGLPTDRFVFEGFLPSRPGKRREKLLSLKGEDRVMVFYESPRRILAALADLAEVMGNREVVVARELSKVHEEFVRGALADVMGLLKDRRIKGEVVLLVAPQPPGAEVEGPQVDELVRRYLATGKASLKDVVKRVALETGTARSEVYTQALMIKKES